MLDDPVPVFFGLFNSGTSITFVSMLDGGAGFGDENGVDPGGMCGASCDDDALRETCDDEDYGDVLGDACSSPLLALSQRIRFAGAQTNFERCTAYCEESKRF